MRTFRTIVYAAFVCILGLAGGRFAGLRIASAQQQCSGGICRESCQPFDGDPFGTERTHGGCQATMASCSCQNGNPAAGFCRVDYCNVCKTSGKGGSVGTCYVNPDSCKSNDTIYQKCQGIC
jgi:hypothetical protein